MRTEPKQCTSAIQSGAINEQRKEEKKIIGAHFWVGWTSFHSAHILGNFSLLFLFVGQWKQ